MPRAPLLWARLRSPAVPCQFLYINQAFQPAPDEILLNLYTRFKVDGKLMVYYARTPAWG